jgi:hypothetical protein
LQRSQRLARPSIIGRELEQVLERGLGGLRITDRTFDHGQIDTRGSVCGIMPAHPLQPGDCIFYIAGGYGIGWLRMQCCLVPLHSGLTITQQLLHQAECSMQIRIRLLPGAALSLLQQLHRPMPSIDAFPALARRAAGSP